MQRKTPSLNCGETSAVRFNELMRKATKKYRTVEEAIRHITVEFTVDVKRVDSKTGGYLPLKRHFSSKEQCLDDLLTKVGRDLIHNACFMYGVPQNPLTYYAVCNPTSFSPLDTDTTLNGEITTPTQMARHQCIGTINGVDESFTHTSLTNQTVVVCAFKNNGASPITGIKGYGNFNAGSGGTLGTESAFTSLDLGVTEIMVLTVTLTLG